MSTGLAEYVKSGKIGDTSSSSSSYLPQQWFSLMKSGTQDAASNDSTLAAGNTESELNSWFSQANHDPCLPSLTKKQRILGFMICLLMAIFCFFMASLYLPVLVLKARKFAVLYSMGTMFFLMSFASLWGPVNHVKHLLSGERLIFTSVYFLTIGATLYFSLWKKAYILTIMSVTMQLLVMVWYVISYIPGGQTGLQFFYKIFYAFTKKTANTVLPI